MDDLELVSVGDAGLGPVGAANDDMVEFDGDALARQRKKLQQMIEVDLRRNFAIGAVYRYRYHGFILECLNFAV